MSSPADTGRPDLTPLARIFEDDQLPWTRTRRVRRRAVLAEAGLQGLLVLLTVWAASTEAGWTGVFTVAWCVGMLAFVPLHSLLNSGIRGLFDRSSRTLDEHQRRLRASAYAAVGWWSTGLTMAAWACGIAVVAVTGHTALGVCLSFLLWFTAGLLPYWRLAWTLPDEDSSVS